MALTADRNTPYKAGEIIPYDVAASVKIFAGSMAALNSSGYLQPAADAAGMTVVGRADEQVDNSNGANGDKTAPVRKRRMFLFANSATNPVAQAHVGKTCYVEDDETVSSSGGSNNIVAGTVERVDSNGVWVWIG